MRYFDKLPQEIAKPCEDLINYIENPDKSIELSGFDLFSDLGVDSDFIRSFDLDYLGSSYRIELEYVERHNGDSLYVKNNDRRLIQYVFNKFVFEKDGRVVFKHDGKLFGVKNWSSKDVLEEAKKLDLSLKISDNEIVLASFQIDDFSDEVKDNLLVNLIKYAIIRSNKRYQIVNNSPEIKNTHQIKNMYSSLINLLKYKKQLILQGPPGTGKTRLAKEIAKKLLDDSLNKKNINTENLSDDFLSKIFHLNDEIKSSNGSTKYVIIKARKNSIVVSGETRNSSDTITFDRLRECIYYPEKFPLGTGLNSQYRAATNFVNEILKSNSRIYAEKIDLHDNDQFKLIQFHPSYTYEDFVRGIVSKPNDDGDGIIYEAENKLLADFAQRALESYNKPLTPMWKVFRDFLNNWTSENHEKLYFDNEKTVRLLDVFQTKEDNVMLRFETFYHGTQSWHMQTWIDIKDLFNNENYNNNFKGYNYASNEIKIICDYFIKFIKKEYISSVSENYVLIIDEINRANLSSVLGELIYALEYRGEAVESMYAVGNDSKLILPPNLYIIGTMNTADRSVGHIDYAIRRRFAFVDVLPKDLSEEVNISFDTELFYSVEKLFDTNLSPEFEKKDVQLGHSYFIDKSKDGGSMDIRLEYEIKPILLEYVKDGVLIGDDIKKLIEDLEPSI